MPPPATPLAGQALFTPISHPELRRLGRKNIHTFVRERARYLLRIQDVQTSGSTINPVSLKASIDPDLLMSMIEFEEFEGVTELSGLTEGMIKSWLNTQSEVSFDSLTVEELNNAVRAAVRMNIHETDPEMRIKSLFMDYKSFLRTKKWDALITKNPKLAVEQMCSLLKPPALKKKIEDDLELGQYELRKKFMPFYKHLLEQAIHCDKFVSISSFSERKTTNNKPFSSSGSNSDRPQSYANSTRKQFPSSTPRAPATNLPRPGPSSAPVTNSSPKELPDCLNKKCTGKHLLKDCPITSADDRRVLLKEFYERKKSTTQLKALSSAPAPTGRFRGTLADAISVTVNGDTGADHSAISEQYLDELAEKSVFVQVLPLRTPITASLALTSDEDEVVFSSKKKARISTTLDLPIGPMRLRNVEFLVFEQYMDEVILSRPLMKSIGFDLKYHLSIVRDTFHDSDFSHIGFDFSDASEELPTIPSIVSQRLLDRTGRPMTTTEDRISGTTKISIKTFGSDPVFYGDGPDDDPFRNDDTPAARPDDSTATRRVLDEQYDLAIKNGLPADLHQDLKNLLTDYSDIFRTRMGAYPAVKVPPMLIKLQPDAKPVRVKLRRYSPPQAEFLRNKTDELLRLGLVVKNNRSPSACAPLLVPKQGPEGFRFTVDLRPVNRQTVPFAWPMPNLESATSQLSNASCFASIDLCHCYWQFPIENESRECQSFITPDGVFTPTRVLHGQSKATAYVQSTVQELCLEIRDVTLQWLDDILFHCVTPRVLLQALKKFFEICQTYGLKLHASKCQFFLRSVTWCGRVISEEGIRLDPARLVALVNMPRPKSGDQLQQFLCASNWMRSAIPSYTAKVEPLHKVLEEVFQKVNKRTSQAARKVLISDTTWSSVHDNAFQTVKQCLKDSVTLAHADSSKLLCLFTDASDTHWGAVLTQIPPKDIDLPFEDQRHEPLSFLSGSFKGSSSRWSTPEKEAFSIVESVSRLDYLVQRPEGFLLFTDHKNLTFIFNPVSLKTPIPKHVANKIERWALILSSFHYTIVHISEEENCWADLLSRWGASPTESPSTKISALLTAPVAPDLDPDFKWPSSADISTSQASALEKGDDIPDSLVDDNGIWKTSSGAVWIPKDDTALILRICIIGHCGRAGHRGTSTTFQNISEYCYWQTMKADIRAFCNTCLHCVATSGSHRTPRPLAHALHSDKPNELIHFDYLFMGKSDVNQTYVLIVKDDATSYT